MTIDENVMMLIEAAKAVLLEVGAESEAGLNLTEEVRKWDPSFLVVTTR